MDETNSVGDRTVESQFQIDRFSRKTLALVYQRLVVQNETPKAELAANCFVETQPLSTMEGTP